jgi:hypothetical protein
MDTVLNLINRIRKFDPKKLTPIQIIVLVASTIVGIWVLWMVIQAILTLVPIAAGVLAIYLAYRWLSSKSEDIPEELTKSKNQRIVDEAIANVKATANNVFGTTEKTVTVTEKATAKVVEEAALENLSVEATEQVEAVEDEKLVVKQIVNPETGFKEPDISRLIEREEQKLKEIDRNNEEVLSQIEQRRRRLLGKDGQQ